MSTPAAVEPFQGIVPGSDHHDVKDAPSVSWKLGCLVLNDLPEGPAAWALRTTTGRTIVRGWISSDAGRAAIQLPSLAGSLLLEIRSGSDRWNMAIPEPPTTDR